MKIIVAGTGQMGTGIVELLASEVREIIWLTTSSDSGQLAVIDKKVKRILKKQQRKNMCSTDFCAGTIQVQNGFSGLEGSDFLFEAITENYDVKMEFYRDISSCLDPTTIVGSNTSSLSIKKLSKNLNVPENFLGVHFFNPPSVMKLVEVVRYSLTSQGTVDRTIALLCKLSKTPIVVQDTPGFVVNRLLMPMINGAVQIAAEQIASIEEIDQAMMLGANHPIGPLKLADLIGIDIVVEILESMYKETKNENYKPHKLMIDMVDGGKFGRKAKSGFYSY